MLRIAFIGAGQMARAHRDALRRVPTPHQVVGVCDLRAEAAREFAERASPHTKPYTSVAELLQASRPDVVHVCTHPATHVEVARQALLSGAHVYIEKPFAETRADAEALFELAETHGRLRLCAGHQLLRDPAFRALMKRAAALQPLALVDSYFAFRPPRLHLQRSAPRALAEQLLDVLPHPLYTLVAALEQLVPDGTPELAHCTASPTDLHAVVQAGAATGRLAVSLRARPVASLLTVTGSHGTLTTDFVRGMVIGAGNDGTSPLEKIANPFVEAAQLAWRSGVGLSRRLLRGVDYPGLAELIGDFYAAVASGALSPVSVDHLRRVTDIYEELAAQVRAAADRRTRRPAPALAAVVSQPPVPVAVVTGAGGFLGRAVTRELTQRGFAVRGVCRSQPPEDANVRAWVRADLATDIPDDVFAGATVVVHAAAATGGGFDAHERDSVTATRQVVRAMIRAGVRQLVYVSSISVLEPPRSARVRQNERTPLAGNAGRLGPYTWGKCAAEAVVAAADTRGEISARIVRPAALFDWDDLEVPGLVGKRLFGSWHLGFGRPGLPFAACEVGAAGAAIAWIAAHFDAAPTVVNLMDPVIDTRARLLELYRQRGWSGRFVWVPIRLLAAGVTSLSRAVALARRSSSQQLSVWGVLRPRRFDSTVSARVLAAARQPEAPATATDRSERAVTEAEMSQVYG